ncbi:MAG TPA: metalloregulator ArsR/SmtB family transcription factor [Candidatus Dormibacteraeota bacterium]
MDDLGLRFELPAHFTALGNPTRLRILEALAEHGEMTVNELAATLRISQPRVSWHLALLRRGGVINQRREGRAAYCALDLDRIRRMHSVLWTLLTEHRRIGVKV